LLDGIVADDVLLFPVVEACEDSIRIALLEMYLGFIIAPGLAVLDI
jgi:hypothetical protein